VLELDPPDLRLAATCACPKPHLHVIKDGASVRVDWMLGRSAAGSAAGGVGVVRGLRNCLRCGVPLRVERVDNQQAAGG
jgi:hypothetical protein